MVTIRYFGHACFLTEDSNGLCVITDPFHCVNEQKPHLNIGYPPIKAVADYVLVSHTHNDHNAVEVVGGNPQVISAGGPCEFDNFSCRLVEAYHDDKQGAERGISNIMLWEADNVRFCHLGDLGQAKLSEAQLRQIGRVDVLFLPIGGGFTIGAEAAMDVLAQLAPKLAIPMHFKTKQVPFLPLELPPFQELVNGVYPLDKVATAELEVGAASLPSFTSIAIMHPVD